MWEIKLKLSKRLLCLYSLFYLGLLGLLYIELSTTLWPIAMIAILLVGVIEYYRCYRGWLILQGDFAIISDLKQIYFRRQRWRLYRSPLFLQYAVIVHLQSIRHNKRRTLCLMFDHVSRSDWRKLCYLLQRWR
ncbi:protein YgfX [Utexia brackfieldae]|uniref:protein YgfX n=1 Tax=Utexia brackfieldae TaxID=3074108 RepID=UPI00370DB2B3